MLSWPLSIHARLQGVTLVFSFNHMLSRARMLPLDLSSTSSSLYVLTLEYSHVGPCLTCGSDESCRSPTIQHVTWEPGAPDACYMRGFTLSVSRGTAFPSSPSITEPTRLSSVKHTTVLPMHWLFLKTSLPVEFHSEALSLLSIMRT